jgi:hypothetical protein
MGKGMADFAAFLKGNDAVKKEIEAARKTSKGKELSAAIVKIAAKQGFTFTAAELDAELDKGTAKALKNEELSDEQLDLVAGGKGGGDEEGIACIGDTIGAQIFGYSAQSADKPTPPTHGGGHHGHHP